MSPDPTEAWTLFKLHRNEERKSRLEEKSQQLKQQLATGQKAVLKEEKPKVLTVGEPSRLFGTDRFQLGVGNTSFLDASRYRWGTFRLNTVIWITFSAYIGVG